MRRFGMSRFILQKACFTCILAVYLLSCIAASQTATEVKVQIINSPPVAYDVQATSIVKSNSTSIVWCTGAAEDLNSFRDIKIESAFIGMPSEAGFLQKRSPNFLQTEQVSVIKGIVLAGFVTDSTTPYGKWACVVQASDSSEAKGENKTFFTIAPESCGDGIQDYSEESIDCGGSCTPCTCFNGVQDGTETGVDCGGLCKYCREKGTLSLTLPSDVSFGEVVPIQVKTDNKGMVSLIRATKPDGGYIVFKTDDSGVFTLKPDQVGVWKINADLYGFAPAQANVNVRTPMTTYLIYAVAAVIVLLIIYVIYQKLIRKKGPKTVCPPAEERPPPTIQ